MNTGIGASLAAVLDQVVWIHAEARADPTKAIAPKIPCDFLALPGGNRGRGNGLALAEVDRILVTVGWIKGPGEGVASGDLRRVGIRSAVADLNRVGFQFWTLLDISATVATEDAKQRDK